MTRRMAQLHTLQSEFEPLPIQPDPVLNNILICGTSWENWLSPVIQATLEAITVGWLKVKSLISL